MTRSRSRRSTGTTDIRQVAHAAGVSPATVSRVLNGVTSVNQELRARVQQVIAELGYKPNEQARALVAHRSRTLGLLVSEITNPFFPELIQTFQDIANDHGYEVLVGSTNYRPERAPDLIRQFVQRKVEGVAVMTFRHELELLRPLLDRQIPLVTIDAPLEGKRTAVIEINYLQGMLQAVRHLAALGHRELAFVGGPPPHRTNQMRVEAFREAIQQIELKTPDEWILRSDHTLEGGVRAAEQLMASSRKPTAILCSNDMTAIGVLRMAHRSGRVVPKQLSVVGLDDIHMSAFLSPALTTIRMSRALIAAQAFETLEQLRKQGAVPADPFQVSTELVVRESTCWSSSAHHGRPALPTGS